MAQSVRTARCWMQSASAWANRGDSSTLQGGDGDADARRRGDPVAVAGADGPSPAQEIGDHGLLVGHRHPGGQPRSGGGVQTVVGQRTGESGPALRIGGSGRLEQRGHLRRTPQLSHGIL